MRALARWSDNSLSVTTPRPCQGEPSRRIADLLFVLEVTGVDRLQARLVERELLETAAGSHDFYGGFGAQIAVTGQTEAAGRRLHDATNPLQPRQPPGDIGAAIGFDFEGIAATQHLAAEFVDRPHQHNAAAIEQRDAVAHALHPVEQMRRQQDADAGGFQRPDQIQEFDAALRIEPVAVSYTHLTLPTNR